jgi:DnaK suppressor protein
MATNKNAEKLSDKELKDIRKSLLKMRNEVRERIKSKKENEMPENEVGDEADNASQSLDKEVLFEITDNAQALLEQIEAALRRIAKGIYGVCESCRRPITRKRIAALPFARYCINCQSSNESSR